MEKKSNYMGSFSILKDDDLVAQIATGNHEALTILYTRYKIFAKKLVSEYLTTFHDDGISFEELEAVALSSLNEAMKKYVPGHNSFYSYWIVFAKHALGDYAEKNSYRLGAKMFKGVSLDDTVKNDTDLILGDIVGEEDRNIKDILDNKNFIDFLYSVKNRLGRKDIKIVELVLKGFEVKEIAKKLKMKIPTIYYRFNLLKKVYNLYISNIQK